MISATEAKAITGKHMDKDETLKRFLEHVEQKVIEAANNGSSTALIDLSSKDEEDIDAFNLPVYGKVKGFQTLEKLLYKIIPAIESYGYQTVASKVSDLIIISWSNPK